MFVTRIARRALARRPPAHVKERAVSDPVQVLPLDAHNAALVANVHPPDWKNPTPDGRYNLVVIGAGTAGLITAAGRREPRREGRADRAPPDGRRLPERRLRAVEGADPRRAHGSRGARGSELGLGGELAAPPTSRRRWSACARSARASATTTPRSATREEFGVDVYLGDARFTGAGHASTSDGTTLRFATRRDRDRRARRRRRRSPASPRRATSTTRRSSRSPSGRGGSP